MKIKPGYKLRKMCGSSIVVAVGKASAEFNGMVTLNESGEILWKRLVDGAEISDLTAVLMEEYGVDETTAKADALEFISKIEGAGFIE